MSKLDIKAMIDKLFDEPPEDFTCWLALGDAYMEMGRLTDAVHAFERAHEIFPEHYVGAQRLVEARAALAKIK